MKTLYESLLDDLTDMEAKLDITKLQSQILKFILDNYYCHPNCLEITGPDENGLCYVSCKKRDVALEIRNKNVTSLTNGMFVWDKVYGNFICRDCPNLTSLEGAPKEVGGSFNCQRCLKLTSLEGAPHLVGRFDCCFCDNLTSLKGAPKEVKEFFDCQHCSKLTSLEGAPQLVGSFDCCFCDNLTSLKGAPKKVMMDFNCEYCDKLDSLKGAPKIVNGDFYCGRKFSTTDVKKISKVKGRIGCRYLSYWN